MRRWDADRQRWVELGPQPPDDQPTIADVPTGEPGPADPSTVTAPLGAAGAPGSPLPPPPSSPVPPPPHGTPPGGPGPGGSRTVLFSVLAVLLCAALGFGGWLFVHERDGDSGKAANSSSVDKGSQGDKKSEDGPNTGASDKGERAGGNDRKPPDGTPGTPTRSGPPERYRLGRGPDGASLYVPTGWRRSEPKDDVVRFDRSDGQRLLVFWVEDATPYRSVTLAEGYIDDKPRYRRLALTGSPGTMRPAELEYVYEDDESGLTHAVDRRFRASDGELYGVVASGPVGSTEHSVQREMAETAARSFCPAGGGCAG